jgi:hypothetical protein
MNWPYFTCRKNFLHYLNLSILVDLLIVLYTSVEFKDETVVFNVCIKIDTYMASGYIKR